MIIVKKHHEHLIFVTNIIIPLRGLIYFIKCYSTSDK